MIILQELSSSAPFKIKKSLASGACAPSKLYKDKSRLLLSLHVEFDAQA